MIWTFKIELLMGAFKQSNWQATIELDSSSTLEDIHFIIQQAVDFDNDHLYEFYVSRTPTSHDKTQFDDENEEVYTTTIGSIYPLGKNKNLYYFFDYGDSWLFKLTKSRKKPHPPVKGVKYPRVLEEIGHKPDQYPDWDE